MFTLDQVAPGPLSAVRQTPTIPMANDLSASVYQPLSITHQRFRTDDAQLGERSPSRRTTWQRTATAAAWNSSGSIPTNQYLSGLSSAYIALRVSMVAIINAA